MKNLIVNIGSLATICSDGKKYKSGNDMQDLREIKNAAMLISNKIEWIGDMEHLNTDAIQNKFSIQNIIDAKGKAIIPGFVDSHTHIMFAGDRSEEFGKRLRGATYAEIAASGGGILTTVKATREASEEVLIENAKKLALSAMSYGTTAIEIKSGYGLSIESEIKMLRAIKKLKGDIPLHVKVTFLGAHDFPPEHKNSTQKYVDIICHEMIPLVAEEKLADFCDAFIDKGYYTIEQGRQIFQTALNYGLKLKAHADELADVDAAFLAAEMGAVSADHLLFISDKGIQALKNSGTIATLLPGTAYFIRLPYAPAGKIINSQVPVALATDCNPGSCFTENMQIILSLSVINMGMTAEQALVGATLNGAAALDSSNLFGSLEVGKSADFLVLDSNSYIDLFYHFGINHVKEVWIKGTKQK